MEKERKIKYDIKVANLPRNELSKICERIKAGTLKFRWKNGCKYVSSEDLKNWKGGKPGRKKRY